MIVTAVYAIIIIAYDNHTEEMDLLSDVVKDAITVSLSSFPGSDISPAPLGHIQTAVTTPLFHGPPSSVESVICVCHLTIALYAAIPPVACVGTPVVVGEPEHCTSAVCVGCGVGVCVVGAVCVVWWESQSIVPVLCVWGVVWVYVWWVLCVWCGGRARALYQCCVCVVCVYVWWGAVCVCGMGVCVYVCGGGSA